MTCLACGTAFGTWRLGKPKQLTSTYHTARIAEMSKTHSVASLTSCKTDNAGVSACSFQELKLGGGTTSWNHWNHWKPTKCVVQWQVCHLIVVWSNVISDLIVFDIQISAFATHSAARIPSICIWHSKGSCTLRLGLSPSHNYPVQVKCKASWSRIESDLHGGQALCFAFNSVFFMVLIAKPRVLTSPWTQHIQHPDISCECQRLLRRPRGLKWQLSAASMSHRKENWKMPVVCVSNPCAHRDLKWLKCQDMPRKRDAVSLRYKEKSTNKFLPDLEPSEACNIPVSRSPRCHHGFFF